MSGEHGEKLVRVRVALVLVGLCAAIGTLLVTVHAEYPLQEWLFPRYATYALLGAYFGLGCLTAGQALLRASLGYVLPLREHLALSFPLGLLAYFGLAFCAGLLGLLGTAFFVCAPLVLFALGARPSLRYARRLVRHWRHARARSAGVPRSWGAALVAALGCASLGLIYFSILSPLNASFDARWYHLPLAEQYANSGRIFRFDEGWVLATNPHLASLVYTWAFLLPGARLFDWIELSAHLEFLIFLATVAAVPALASRLLPRAHARSRVTLGWVAMFLFPGLFLYDSSLNLGADHVAALWAIPVYLMLLRAWPALGVRECCVLAALLSGALLTKYTAILIVAPPIGALALRTLLRSWAWLRGSARSPWPGPLAALALGLVLTSPHWLKNWIWYGDPLFPQLQRILTPRPWLPEANTPYFLDYAVSWHVSWDWSGLLQALQIAFTYAFVHHDWPALHGSAPVFGFLFTLSLCFLPFLGKAPRLWGIFLLGHLGVVVWTFISWQDRYLQVLVPWMASAVAAAFLLVHRLHAATRVALGALVALQVVWGSDVYFFTTHAVLRASPAEAAIDLLNTAREKKYAQRNDLFQPYQAIGAMLPRGAKVLVHGTRQSLGLGHPRVHDSPGTQGGLVYSRLSSPRAVYDALRELGVTHLVWDAMSEGNDTLASDFVFFDFAARYAEGARRIGTFTLARMPTRPPPATRFGERVAYLACQGRYAPAGVYRLPELTASVFLPPSSPAPIQTLSGDVDASALVSGADYVVFQPSCNRGVSTAAIAQFDPLAGRGACVLYARRRQR